MTVLTIVAPVIAAVALVIAALILFKKFSGGFF
nr:MAG TPA: protein of unknown function (DUF4519) [Caudoviricetes sp.]